MKRNAGEVTNNPRLQAEGASEEMGGRLKQAVDKVKDAFGMGSAPPPPPYLLSRERRLERVQRGVRVALRPGLQADDAGVARRGRAPRRPPGS